MAKLTSQQRKNLPDDQFGLPEDKAYPMPDEAHVRSAITYFNKCPQGKKKELAGNINRIAKSYGMKVKLSTDSPFKHYADKEILSESAELVSSFYGSDTFDGLNRFQANKNIRMGEYESKVSIRNAINDAIAKVAKNRIDEIYMVRPHPETCSIEEFVHDTDLKATYDITRNFLYGNSVEEIMDRLKKMSAPIYDKSVLNDIIGKMSCYAKDSPEAQAYLSKAIAVIDDKEGESPDFFGTLTKKLMEPTYQYSPDHWRECKTPKFRNFDETEIKWFHDNLSTLNDLAANALSFLVKKGYPLMNLEAYLKQEYLMYEMDRRGILEGYFIIGDNTDNIMLGKGDYNIFTMAKMRDAIWIPIHNATAKGDDGRTIMVITLMMVYDKLHPNYFMDILDKWNRSRYQKIPKMITRRVVLKWASPAKSPYNNCFDSEDIRYLTEGIHFTKEGDLKFVFDSNRSYMDKYSEIHKAIVENHKTKNYEAMKHDLAYMFALITACEDKMRVKAENDTEYMDAQKARMFAKNDFRRYMKIVTDNDRKFNFMKFYQEHDYDKKVYTVYSDDLIGLRNLFRKLVL